MRRVLALVLAAALALVVALPAGAGNDRNFKAAPLKGANEVPAVDSQGNGVAHFKLNKDGDALSFSLIVANLEDVTQAHIHCGPADANGGVTAFLFGFADPAVNQNGPLASGVITDAQVLPIADSAVCPGGIEDFDDLIAQIRAGNTYVNVHTVANPGGEIRGQIR